MADPTAPPADPHVLLRLLLEQDMDHALILLDSEGRVAAWLGAAANIFAYSAEEMMGSSLDRIFVPEDRERGIPAHELTIAAATGRAEDDRWQMRRDGSRFWASGAVRALKDESGRLVGFGKILRDRTDVKAQIDSLTNRLDALRQADERRRVFLATLGHELRNPMMPLVNALELIRISVPQSPALEYPVKLIQRQIDFIRRLADDLMDLTRVSTGKVQLQIEAVDLDDVVRESVEACRWGIEQHRHRVELLLPPTRTTLEADRARLQQVLVNLLTNAAKYTPGPGRIWVKVTVEAQEAVIRIEDTGVGIPTEMLPHVFELFTQVESSRNNPEGGLGVGLHVVKQVVDLHGGTVQVKSEGRNRGTEFTVRLPLRQARRND